MSLSRPAQVASISTCQWPTALPLISPCRPCTCGRDWAPSGRSGESLSCCPVITPPPRPGQRPSPLAPPPPPISCLFIHIPPPLSLPLTLGSFAYRLLPGPSSVAFPLFSLIFLMLEVHGGCRHPGDPAQEGMGPTAPRARDALPAVCSTALIPSPSQPPCLRFRIYN